MIMVVAEEGKFCIVFVENIIENGDFDDHKHSVDMRHTGKETTTTTTTTSNKYVKGGSLAGSTAYKRVMW